MCAASPASPASPTSPTSTASTANQVTKQRHANSPLGKPTSPRHQTCGLGSFLPRERKHNVRCDHGICFRVSRNRGVAPRLHAMMYVMSKKTNRKTIHESVNRPCSSRENGHYSIEFLIASECPGFKPGNRQHGSVKPQRTV